jgi:hypothetical protein
MKGACHCGRITIALPHPPEYLNQCNCSLCFKLGSLWGYYTTAQVAISGDTKAYTRADLDPPLLDVHFCDECGATTHWSPSEHATFDRIGVNMRLFDRAALEGIEVRYGDRLRHEGGAVRHYYREPTAFGEAGVTP